MLKKNPFLILIFGLIFILLFSSFLFFFPRIKETEAQANPEAKLFLSPSTGTFLVGSTFDVSIIVDTGETSINTVKVDLSFPADNLQIVNPSSGKSFISLWLEQPAYSNIWGTISFAGGIPEGIKTSSGIVSIITFRAIKAGEVTIKISPSSNVLANDGKGTQILSSVIHGRYILTPKPPEGPVVFSHTHSDETQWYNNNNPVVEWEKETNVTDFSFVLDNYPKTIPDNTPEGKETIKSYENLPDGLWYFHIKAKKEGIWGEPSHFLLRIDTTPPASFEPKIEFLLAQIIGRAFVSFFTTDSLSGIDHYEITTINKSEPPVEAPVFIEAETPYQLPQYISGEVRVIVRAIDKAGNVKDESIDTKFPTSFVSLIKSNWVFIILFLLIAIYVLITKPKFRPKFFTKIFNHLKKIIKIKKSGK